MGLGPWFPWHPKGWRTVALALDYWVAKSQHPPSGARYGRERLAGGAAPDGPPLTLGFVLVSFTGKFADVLVIDWPVN